MARLTDENVTLAKEIIDRYPRAKSALIPLLHIAQEQDGWVTDEAMRHIAELIGVTPLKCSVPERSTRCSNLNRSANISSTYAEQCRARCWVQTI